MKSRLSILGALLCMCSVAADRFSSDIKATRAYFHDYCEYVVTQKTNCEVIFIGGYYMRDLVAAYQIFGEKRYLDTAIAYADALLEKQGDRGYWQTGYGKVIYLADTGSALGLYVVLYDHVDKQRKRRYFDAVKKYTNAIERDGLIRPSGALDCGFRSISNSPPTNVIGNDYTISSALTGGEIFTWMYHMTGEEKYRQVAHNSLNWIFSTMREDGVIPYVLPFMKANPAKKGDAKNDYQLWTNSMYLTSAYVGEGVLSFDLYCGSKAWQKEIREKVKPHINFLLNTQNPDGTWSWEGPWDQKRTPGIVNFLTWYYDHADRDPRIPAAIRRWNAFILVPENAKRHGMLNEGAKPDPKDQNAYDCLTSLVGRALADIIRPGVDAKW